IVNGDDFQIVYSDTPGIMEPNYKLQASMMKFVTNSLKDADIILFVTEIKGDSINDEFIEILNDSKIPKILVINKIDLSNQEELEEKVEYWHSKIPTAAILPVSALEKFNVDEVFNRIMEVLPECPPYFSKDELTDKSMRFFVSEIVREKVLLNYQKEIPYSVEIVVNEYKESEDIIRIYTTIFVTRESQKMILLGHKGKAIKQLGIDSRIDIEEFVNKKVYLELTVKVSKDWRNDEKQLKRFGYEL
ncbi:MAG: GTPase Era, partial [Saprospiraceae bacterium]|nr:GTPase Era [Saprospiraceae bacterium]